MPVRRPLQRRRPALDVDVATPDPDELTGRKNSHTALNGSWRSDAASQQWIDDGIAVMMSRDVV
jgi:hypothetical protein